MSTISAENLQLVRSFQLTGDPTTAEQLLALNAPVLRGMVREALPPFGPLEFDDVLIEGQLGLLESAVRFDFSRGFQFLTYARWRIAQAMTRLVEREYRLIHVPADAVTQARRTGTADELPAIVASLDQPAGEDEAGTLGELLPGPLDLAAQVEAQVIAGAALAVLTARERQVIVRRYGLEGHAEQSLAEVGRALGLSREGVRLAEGRAMRKMRKALGVVAGRR